jgi:hypothetical protein
MKITKDAYAALKYPDGISRSNIAHEYCERMTTDERCPYTLTNNCNICIPLLQELKRNLTGAKSENAVIIWRLRELSRGELSVWAEQERTGPTQRHDAFGLPTSEEFNPFHKLSCELGVKS